MNGFFSALVDWWHKPFSQEMDAWHVVALVGLVMAAIIMWLIVLGHLRNVKLSG